MKSQENKIYFGGGCFWCIEAFFEQVNGVNNVTSGYSGGFKKKPTYKEVISGKTGHAEVCEISYNSNIISLKTLLEIFFISHDPTTINRQGNDIGTQYRSIILSNKEEELQEIKNYVKKIQINIFKEKKIVTEIKKLNKFYAAEDYHQDFYSLNKKYPYCEMVITPKMTELRKKLKKYFK
ncbi:MAG: peptide-methionine (S)-S-oxide reductase [Flavobacteriales bacterium]|nr:peptide-methionine (S)-S-oxide reductase [Flavobacteriales bacterium]